eukprot:7007679-Pyramimonas_sp.AAC.1
MELPMAESKAKIRSSSPVVARQVMEEVRHHVFRACSALEVPGAESRGGVPIRRRAIRMRVRAVRPRVPRSM